MITLPWYGKLEKMLMPAQGLVNLLLVGIILFSVYVIIKGDNVAKTGWLVYLISP